MEITDSKGNSITCLNDWAKVFDTPKKRLHWKIGRSAYSIADFIMNKHGEEKIMQLVSSILSEQVILESGIPELEIRFDAYGHGREHDLGIYGKTSSGKTIFIGVEAKVDESFNETVADVYLKAKAKELAGISTNLPSRIEDLITLNFKNIDSKVFELRYQLLYATAGTVATDADIYILLMIVFKTELYDETIGTKNYQDYSMFLKAVDAKPREYDDEHVTVHQLSIGEKSLHAIYMYQ